MNHQDNYSHAEYYDYPEYYQNNHLPYGSFSHEDTKEPIDWPLVARVAPWLIVALGWVLWFAFLLIPTVYDSHGADRYPLENNVLFTLTGLVLALASQTALDMGHKVRVALFVFVILILSYWF